MKLYHLAPGTGDKTGSRYQLKVYLSKTCPQYDPKKKVNQRTFYSKPLGKPERKDSFVWLMELAKAFFRNYHSTCALIYDNQKTDGQYVVKLLPNGKQEWRERQHINQ